MPRESAKCSRPLAWADTLALDLRICKVPLPVFRSSPCVRGSQRELKLYDERNLRDAVTTKTIDISPSVLVPTYDPDTGMLYLMGRGEAPVLVYEIQSDPTADATFLAKLDSKLPAQGAAFFPKWTCHVQGIEIAKILRLCKETVENVSFAIPRAKVPMPLVER